MIILLETDDSYVAAVDIASRGKWGKPGSGAPPDVFAIDKTVVRAVRFTAPEDK